MMNLPMMVTVATGHMLHHKLSKKAKAQVMLLQHFWNHWNDKYLTSLREAHTADGQIGDVVMAHLETNGDLLL